MKTRKYIIGLLIISLAACKDSIQQTDDGTQSPKVEFSLSDIPANQDVKTGTYVNDLEGLFTEEQNNELENYLKKLKNEKGKKFMILTVPSKNNLSRDWEIGCGFTDSGILITLSESLKEISIGTATNTEEILPEITREEIIRNTIIPELEKGNHYSATKSGILEILKNWN